MLIVGSYADGIEWDQSGESPIAALSGLLASTVPPSVAVHLLPFFPSHGDFGFAIDDWFQVRPDLGTWTNIRALAASRPLIVDGVYNHVGMGHEWVRAFMSSPGSGADILHAYRSDLKVTGPRSPRGQPVLRSYDIHGASWDVWQTFTADAVDVRLDKLVVLEQIERQLTILESVGVWGIRLDAVAYYAKFPGSGIRHNPGVFALADRIASMVEAHRMNVIAQLDCDDAGLRYYSETPQAHYVLHDFSYSAYLALALLTRDPSPLATHLLATSSAAHPYIRTPRNHDGVLLRSGRLSSVLLTHVIEAASAAGIATRYNGDLPYELNCSAPYLYTRVAPRTDLGSIIELTTAVTGMTDGWSYFYLPSILGFIPEDEGSTVSDSDPRALNRVPVPASFVNSFVGSTDGVRLRKLFEVLSTVHASRTATRTIGAGPVIAIEGTVLRLTAPGGEYQVAANFGDLSARMPLKADTDIMIQRGYSRTVLKPRGYVIWHSQPVPRPIGTASHFRNDLSHETITSMELGSTEGGPLMLVLALDIGGSSVKHGVVDVDTVGNAALNGADTEPLPTLEFTDLLPLVMRVVEAHLKEEPSLKAVGISTTGSVDRMGVVVSAGHFEGYKNVSWRDLLASNFPQLERIVTVNDGRASAWAEYAASPGAHGSHIHAVVGTGVGGGIVYDGDLLLGDSGQAGYLGHIKVTDGPTATCSCGSTGCVEALAAAPAILRNFNQGGTSGSTSGADSLSEVAAAAELGDETAIEAFRKAGYWLGVGLGDAMNVLNPSVVTVGGGVLVASEGIANAGDGGPYFAGVSDGVARAAHKRVAASARLDVARFGNDGGLIGAARLAARERTAAP